LRDVAAAFDVRAARTVAGFTSSGCQRCPRILCSGMLRTTQALPLRVVARHTDFAADIVARFAPGRLRVRWGLNRTRRLCVGGPSAHEKKYEPKRQQRPIHTRTITPSAEARTGPGDFAALFANSGGVVNQQVRVFPLVFEKTLG